MIARLFGIVIVFCNCSIALAQSDTPLVPKKPIGVSFEDVAVAKVLQIESQPMICVAKFIQKESLATTMVREITYLEEKRKRTVTVDGKQVEQEYTIQIPVIAEKPATVKNFTPTQQERFCPVSGVQVFDVKGKLVEPEVWAKLLEKPRHVLLLKEAVGETSHLDPFYMSIVREETLLIFLPKQDADPKAEK